MKRSELEIKGRYAGPEGRCYEIVDLSPGWRINRSGEWVEDNTTRTRHMPGRGEMPYRSNLAVKAYIVHEGGDLQRAVVDPRRLTEPWVEYELKKTADERERVHTNRLLTLLRRNLRTYPGYQPSPMSAYTVSPDGSSVTLPMADLSALMDIAFGERS
jgi:hypothetical protein